MSRKVLKDSNGLLFCGHCGTTRSQKGLHWAKEASVLAHLKHCKGPDAAAQEQGEIRTKLAEVPIPRTSIPAVSASPSAAMSGRATAVPAVPASPSAALPQDLPQGAARVCGSLRARSPISPYRPAGLHAGSLPLESAPAGFVSQADYDRLVDEYNLALIERDEYHQLAEKAVRKKENHDPHLALAQAESKGGLPSWVPWVFGGAVILAIIYGVTSSSGGTQMAGPSMAGASAGGSKKVNSSVGDVFDLGSKGMTFFSKARNAFKI